MHLVVVLVMSDSIVYRMHLQYALILKGSLVLANLLIIGIKV